MPVTCVGLSHRTAPLSVRERLAFGREDALSALLTMHDPDFRAAGIAELSLVSTCNRTELYAAAPDPAFRFSDVPRLLTETLVRSRDLGAGDVAPSLYTHTSTNAIRHLCRVAAGLDSMVLGEAEVLGQVATAHEWAVEAGAAGPILEAAFRTAIRAGRRARAETGICRNPMSTASEAVRLVRELAPTSSTVLIVGTGDLARLLGDVLRNNEYASLEVIGRTVGHAESVAIGIGARARPWHELRDAIRGADVVLTSTAATHALVTRELVQSALDGRVPGRALAFVDLAVPRDVEAQIGQLPGVTLYDLDTLQHRLNGNLAERLQEVPRVEAIIEEEVTLFQSWRRGVELRPLLAAMHSRGEEIRRRETERALRRLGGTAPEVRQQIEALSRSLVAKLLHEPSARLRTEMDPARSQLYLGAVRELFGLDMPAGESAATERHAV
jgi:glutamyl-tRNA reductase